MLAVALALVPGLVLLVAWWASSVLAIGNDITARQQVTSCRAGSTPPLG